MLLTANYATPDQREKAFRYLRQVVRSTGASVVAHEYTLPNLRGYMLAVEGVVLNDTTIPVLDKMKAHEVFAYMPVGFEWRVFAEGIAEVNDDGFRADGSVHIFEDYEVPQALRPTPRAVFEEAIKNSLGC